MSLDDFRNETDSEEDVKEAETLEQPEQTEVAEAEEGEAQAESEETNEDFELEIEEDEPKKPKRTPQEAMLYKLTKKQKQLQGAKTEIEQLKEELEQVKSQLGQPKPAAPAAAPQPSTMATNLGYPPVPVMYEDGINTPEEYRQAYSKWTNDIRQIDQQKAQEQHQQEQSKLQTEIEEKARLERLAGRSHKFITENKINPDKAVEAIRTGQDALDKLTGIEGGGLYLLDKVGEGSEKLAYYFGKNPSELNRVKEWLEEDNTGLRAIAEMTRIVTTKLKPKTSKSKKSLEPDEPLSGNASSKSDSDLQRRYDTETDFGKLSQLRQEARQRGITLINR